jgi:hypothetical protein
MISMRKSLNINFLAQLNTFFYHGGGELTLQSVIKAGRARGHRIFHSWAEPRLHLDIQTDADLYILANLYNNPRSRRRLPHKLLDDIIKNRPFIHIDDAYVDICDQPYLPCNGVLQQEKCPFKASVWYLRFGKQQCFREQTANMYRKSLLNVGRSPLHNRIIQGLLGESDPERFYELKPTIDGFMLGRNVDVGAKDIDNLYVGVLCEAKGFHNMQQRFSKGNIVLVGKRHPLLTAPAFGQEIGEVSIEEVQIYMRRAKNFIFLPRWPEPMGRVVVEAALAGCNLVTNDNVGALSYPFDIANLNNYNGALDEFWETIEQVVK